jgi:hypothetical protein
MYTLAGLLTLVSVYLILDFGFRISDYEPGNPISNIQYPISNIVLVNAAGLYTLYLFGLVILAEGLWLAALAVWRRAWRPLLTWGLSQAVTLSLFAPWLALALPRMRSWSVVTEPASPGFVAQLYGALLALGISTDVAHYTLPAAAFVLLSLAGLAVTGYRLRPEAQPEGLKVEGSNNLQPSTFQPATALLGLFLVLPPLAVWLLTQPRALFYTPQVEARYLLPFAAPVYVLLAWSLVEVGRRWRLAGLVLTIGVLAGFAWSLPQHYAGRILRDELQSMTRVIRAYARPGDAVALVSGNRYPLFLYYYDRLAGPRPDVIRLPRDAPAFTTDNVEAQLAPLLAAHPRLWLAEVDANLEDPQGLARRWLDGQRPKALSLGFGHNALRLYADDPAEPTVPPENLRPQVAGDVPVAPGINLLGYDLPVREFRPGDTIYLGLYFRVEQPGLVAVSWIDAEGRPVEQRRLDLTPVSGAIVRHQLSFQVFDRTPAVRTRFRVEPADSSGPPVLTTPLVVAGTRPLPDAGHIPHLTHAVVGTAVELAGYGLAAGGDCSFQDTAPHDLRLVADPGQPLGRLRFPATARHCALDVTLFWHATHKLPERYTVFVHLLGQAHNPATGGPVWAGHDGEPVDGGYPTTQWLERGPAVADRHRLILDPATPAGVYQVELGMYRQPSVERLPVSGNGADAENRRILLGTIELVR